MSSEREALEARADAVGQILNKAIYIDQVRTKLVSLSIETLEQLVTCQQHGSRLQCPACMAAKGGKSRSEAKLSACRENAKLGGRPKLANARIRGSIKDALSGDGWMEADGTQVITDEVNQRVRVGVSGEWVDVERWSAIGVRVALEDAGVKKLRAVKYERRDAP